jgi:hypothetical protein
MMYFQHQQQPAFPVDCFSSTLQQPTPFGVSVHAPFYSIPNQQQQQSGPRVKIHNPYLQRSEEAPDNSVSFGNSSMNTQLFHHQQQQHQLAQMSANAAYAPSITTEELMQHCGTFVELARSAAGSSYIQSALRGGCEHTMANAALLATELFPASSDLLLDAHGCYVIKSLMERIPLPQLHEFAVGIALDEQLIFSMCTHSLHTRRVVQFLIDMIGVELMGKVLVSRCVEISTTQQGCIIMQRAMDVAGEPLRSALFTTIFANLLRFAFDPFANYVVQHMLEVGDREASSRAVKAAFRGHVIRLSCNKFASNVMEKCLFHLTEDAQHDLIVEMYEITEDELHSMLQDSFGNYMIQSSIALASQRDVNYINDKLKNVLQRTPYGHKIESRLERRLKGRPVGTRSPAIGANSKNSRFARGGRNGGSNNGGTELMEEPW